MLNLSCGHLLLPLHCTIWGRTVLLLHFVFGLSDYWVEGFYIAFGIQAPDLKLVREHGLAYTRCIRYHVLRSFYFCWPYTSSVSPADHFRCAIAYLFEV